MTLVACVIVFMLIVGLVVYTSKASADREAVRREAALRIETEKTIQAQRALEDAPGVTQAAAQERPRRKRQKAAS